VTYSLIARDPETGELGVAVQSHWFSVGPIVPWACPGVGAVATQANAEIAYGPRGLALLAAGVEPSAALSRLRAADPAAESRQVGIVDARGRTAAFTGASAIPFAGHVIGEQVCCQANMMSSSEVWPAMLAGYLSADGPLAWRLLAALEAAERAGGDIRGRQSAAMLVVPAAGEAWETAVSLRIEDHPEPLQELRRLLALSDAYVLAGQADELSGLGRFDQAAVLYRRASELAPGNHELLFWAGLGAAHQGDFDRALRDVRAAVAQQPGWRELLARLPGDQAPAAAALLAQLRT
jgi:uncharacterized Ntn-hydrolase superfamily protein